MEGLNTSAEWVYLIMNTEENLRKKIYGSLPVGKPKGQVDRRGARGVSKLIGTAAWKRLAGEWKNWECKI
jgi:hypothetical protein